MKLFGTKTPAPRLVELPNGDWVIPTDVAAIRFRPKRDNVKPGVIVDMRNHGYITMDADSNVKARALRADTAKSLGL